MAHYAFLDTTTVTEVIVGIDETELIEGLTPEEWYGNFRKQPCVQNKLQREHQQTIRRHRLHLR
jgi:hypothetical protein